jgi:hypothetical protein
MLKRVEVLEKLRGTGSVVHGAEVLAAEAPYRLTVTQDILVAYFFNKTDEVKGQKNITGTVDLPRAQIWGLLGKNLKLILSDGRRLNFFFRNDNTAIQASGDFEPPDAVG